MGSCETMDGEETTSSTLNMMDPQLRTELVPQSWFDLRVFYVRVTNYIVHDSTPEVLTISHSPLDSETLLEVNGKKISDVNPEGITSLLRRDRVDKKSEEVTFVSTDSIRFTRGLMFKVINGKEIMLEGALEISNINGGAIRESRNPGSRWSLSCESKVADDSGFMKWQYVNDGFNSGMPILEVYVAGSFSGAPVVLTKSLQLKTGKKHGELDLRSEYEMDRINGNGERKTQFPSEFDLQLSGYRKYKNEKEGELNHLFLGRREYLEGEEEGQMSWFNAGVRVGVGMSLGICLGVGVGVGLLARTYQKACRSLARGLR